MNFKKFSLLAALTLALSMPVFAQDDSADSENPSDEEWASADDANKSSDDEFADAVSYDGSTDSEFADDEEYASAYAKYKAESTKKSEIERQRNEGFARAVLLGVRGQIGTNTFLLGENDDGWGMGFQIGGGLMVKMNLGIKHLSLAPELTFNYRYYTYEKDMEIYTNKANIDIMMFEIPMIVRYSFEDLGADIYVGLGVNLGLKLTGSSEFSTSGETRENTVATSGMEVGGVFDLGYMLTRWVSIDVRVVQCFTSLLNETLVAEEAFSKSSLNTFYTSLGVTFMF